MKTKNKLILALSLIGISLFSAVTASAAPGDLFSSVNGTTLNGGGSIVRYAPDGTASTFASGLSRPRGLVFDSAGNLFVSTNRRDNSGNLQGTILKFTPDGVMSTFATGFSPAGGFLEGLALDSAGNLFVVYQNNPDPNATSSTIYKVTPDGTVSPFGLQSDCSNCSVPGQSFGLAFDSAGNLLATNDPEEIIYKFAPDGTRSVFAGSSAFTPNQQGPTCLAFDVSGNLFVSTENSNLPGNDTILEFSRTGVESTFATGLANTPRGVAFDAAGNLFVAEVNFFGTGDILEFTPGGGAPTVFASGIGGRAAGNGGPEFLAFQPNTPTGANVMVNIGTVGSAVVALTFPQVTAGGMTMVTPIDPNSAGMLPSGYELTGSNLAFQITTTATYITPPPIIIAFQMPSVDAATFSQLRILHNEGGTFVDVTASDPFAPNPTTQTIYASVSSLSPFVIAKFTLKAQVQQPINADGTSAFTVKRGVVPVKFTLTQDGAPTCALPPATIALTRTAGGTIGAVNESTYVMPADSGSNFRIDSCQYVYNLNAGGLGVGTYRVDVKMNGHVVGSGTFQLK